MLVKAASKGIESVINTLIENAHLLTRELYRSLI